jgi:ABC-type multidrug transport system ATPase subunit
MHAVEVKNISKAYRDLQALDAVNLSVEEGELFGLIGPDGAGKTTLMRILTTLLYPDKGTAEVFGYDTVRDFKEIRQIVGYMPGRFSLYQDLSVEENLHFYARIFDTTVEENYDLIKDIYQQIEPFKKRLAGKLSGGMKQKLALSCALIHKPRILILDEPTFGVDAVSRQEFWEMLKRLKHAGISILVSTPYMDEAALCDRIALMQKGSFLDVDTPQNIRDGYGSPIYAVQSDNQYHLIRDLRENPLTDTAFPFGENVHLTTKEAIYVEEVRDYLESQGHKNVRVSAIEPEIEDCFMKLMQKS